MKRLLPAFLLFLSFSFLACGPEADYFDTQEAAEVSGTTSAEESTTEPARTFFYTRAPENEGEPFTAFASTDFRISHFGDCEYVFELFQRLPENLPGREGLSRDIFFETLTSGQGDLENTWRLFLPEAEYFLNVDSECQWIVEISKVQVEVRPPDNGGGGGGASGGGSSGGGGGGDCNCQGCCSSHGGVVCRDGRTMCGDGTPLSDTCRNKGCIAGGCPGC